MADSLSSLGDARRLTFSVVVLKARALALPKLPNQRLDGGTVGLDLNGLDGYHNDGYGCE